jgi:hypothetical protein
MKAPRHEAVDAEKPRENPGYFMEFCSEERVAGQTDQRSRQPIAMAATAIAAGHQYESHLAFP